MWNCASATRAENLYPLRADLDRAFAEQLAALAGWCDQQGLVEPARRTREWLPADRDHKLLLFDPTQRPETAASDEPPPTTQWRNRFLELRVAHAKELFSLAERAARNNDVSLAMDLLGDTLRNDPNHDAARRTLGYQRGTDAWHTAFTAAKQKAGQVWHDRFGWLPKARVERYEAGERYHRGRWISAEQDQRLHGSIDTGWEVETEHYTVTTNHSLEAAARFGVQLERLHAAWRQACAAYLTPDGRTLLNPPTLRASKRHEVVVFRSQAEYQQALRGEVPADGSTTGFYSTSRRTAYFFVPSTAADGAQTFDDAVLYHEAVHQLFNETRAAVAEPGEKQNFWLIEGIACYFESLQAKDGYLVVGGTQAERFRAAQYRYLNDGFYVPLRELCGMDRRSMQRDPRIARLYSQSSGLTQFLMHSECGRRRDGLLYALTALYSGRDRLATLAETTGEDYPRLDDRYRDYLTATTAKVR